MGPAAVSKMAAWLCQEGPGKRWRKRLPASQVNSEHVHYGGPPGHLGARKKKGGPPGKQEPSLRWNRSLSNQAFPPAGKQDILQEVPKMAGGLASRRSVWVRMNEKCVAGPRTRCRGGEVGTDQAGKLVSFSCPRVLAPPLLPDL